MYAALLGRDGTWIVGAEVRGLRTPAFASTFVGSGDVLLMGKDLHSMIDAYRTTIRLGGAVVFRDISIPLQHAGTMSDGPISALPIRLQRIADSMKLPETLPPLGYRLLLLTIGVLADVKSTPIGALLVKTSEMMMRPVSVRPATES